MRDYIEIVFFGLFMVGLFVGLPVMAFLILWLDFINWRGMGEENLTGLALQRAWALFVHDPYLWLVIALIFAIEIGLIFWVSRKHRHTTTYQ